MARKPRVEVFPVLNPKAAGIDVHADWHWVAVPPGSVPPTPGSSDELPADVRKFGTCTDDLEAIADWLQACGVTTVAMESTGVYWIPLFELLERRGFTVLLVDPRQTRQVSGRPKSDRLDCQWIRRLHGCGLLAGSFRPGDDIVVLRGYLRQRQRLIEDASRQVQHIQKALEEMNVKLTEVVSDVLGLTGLKIIKAILKGERDAATLAHLRHETCKRSEDEIARALKGNWRAEHLFALKQALELYESYQRMLNQCDQQVEACLKTFADKTGGVPLAAKPRRHGKQGHDPRFDARSLLYRLSGADLTAIEGVGENTALVILSEIGPDVSRFPTVKNFTSWLGLCPQHRESNGKIKSRHVRRARTGPARRSGWPARGARTRSTRWAGSTGGSGPGAAARRRCWQRRGRSRSGCIGC